MVASSFVFAFCSMEACIVDISYVACSTAGTPGPGQYGVPRKGTGG